MPLWTTEGRRHGDDGGETRQEWRQGEATATTRVSSKSPSLCFIYFLFPPSIGGAYAIGG